MRYAIYYTPPVAHPFTAAAARWLGRDAATGETFPLVSLGGFDADELVRITEAPRKYGFHATMKAPFRLAEGQSEAALVKAFEAFCAKNAATASFRLAIRRIGPFFALVPDEGAAQVDELAGNVVRSFDHFRAPPMPDETARRQPAALSQTQRQYLDDWGYPYVFEEFRFHMTLTGPVASADVERVQGALDTWFAALLVEPVAVDELAIFIQPQTGCDFRIHTRLPLCQPEIRRTA